MNERLVAAVVAALDQHAFMPISDSTLAPAMFWAACEGCDWIGERHAERVTPAAEHRTHLARMVVAEVTP